MVRLLLEDRQADPRRLHYAAPPLQGGAHRTIQLPLPLRSWGGAQTSSEAVAEIHRLLDLYTYPDVASKLNERGMRSGERKPFTARIVARLQRSYNLTPRYNRPRKVGILTVAEMAAVLGIRPPRVKIWNRHGLIHGHAYNGKNDCLYEHPGDNQPRKAMGVKLSKRAAAGEVAPHRIEEVQCEA